jgi:hypothetical protein
MRKLGLSVKDCLDERGAGRIYKGGRDRLDSALSTPSSLRPDNEAIRSDGEFADEKR